MPTIPLYQQRDRMRPSLGIPRRAPTGVGDAWKTVGQNLGIAANDLQQRAQQLKEKKDTLDVMNAYSDYKDLERDYKFSLTQRKQAQAAGITDDHKEWAEKTRSEISKNLSPEAQAQFALVFQKHLDSELDKTANMERQEFGAYQDGTVKRKFLEAQGEIASNPARAFDYIKEYELAKELVYGRLDPVEKMEDRRALLSQSAETLASQGRLKEALELVDNNVKTLGSKYQDLKDDIVDLVTDQAEALDAQAKKNIEKRQKDAEDNFYLAIQRQQENPESVDAQVTVRALNDAMASRLITREAHKRLKSTLEDPDSYDNDPYVLAEIIDERNPDRAIKLLDSALDDRQIKPETYITHRKRVRDTEFQQAKEFVSKAVQPPLFNNSHDAKVKAAEQMEYFYQLVSKGNKNPWDAAWQVAEASVGELRRTKNGLATPKYWPEGGQKNNITDIEAAERMTAVAYEAGELQGWEYRKQLDLIDRLHRTVQSEIDVNETINAEKLNQNRVVNQAGVN